jgi:hypothetical protein
MLNDHTAVTITARLYCKYLAHASRKNAITYELHSNPNCTVGTAIGFRRFAKIVITNGDRV